MNSLKSQIADLAESFAQSVIAAIRSASLEEILETSQGRGASRGGVRSVAAKGDGRRVRRSASDIAGVVDAIEQLLAKNPSGLRAEQIRSELGLQAKELPRPLAEGLSQKRFSKEGQKRATTYYAKGGGGAAARKSGRKATKKRG